MLGWGWVWLRLGLCCGLCLCLRRQTRPEHTRGDQATAEQTRPGDTGPEYTTKAQTRPTCTHRRHPHRNNLLSSLVRVSSSSNLISLRPIIFGWRMRTKACLRSAALAAAQLASSQMKRSGTVTLVAIPASATQSPLAHRHHRSCMHENESTQSPSPSAPSPSPSPPLAM